MKLKKVEKNWLQSALKEIKKQGLWRDLKEIEKKSKTRIVLSGKELINFCSNDYLGLANEIRVIRAGQQALRQWGTSGSASRLVSGNYSLHLELERALARFKGTESCLIFPSGYLTNLGTIPALVDKDDLIFSDELNHASLIDACRLSRAKIVIFPHLDLNALEMKLKKYPIRTKKLIVIEGIYSMDGDIAPLPEILKLAEKFRAMVYLDEAHSTGVLGETGKGLLEYFGIKKAPPDLLLMGTLSKALGSQGGFICCSQKMRAFLINRARSFIFSTALNPGSLGSALKALELIETEPERILQLKNNIFKTRTCLNKMGLTLKNDPTPIIPIILGKPEITLQVSKKLLADGIFVQAIRPPSVPQNSSRLRISLSSAHTASQIALLLKSLKKILKAKLC